MYFERPVGLRNNGAAQAELRAVCLNMESKRLIGPRNEDGGLRALAKAFLVRNARGDCPRKPTRGGDLLRPRWCCVQYPSRWVAGKWLSVRIRVIMCLRPPTRGWEGPRGEPDRVMASNVMILCKGHLDGG